MSQNTTQSLSLWSRLLRSESCRLPAVIIDLDAFDRNVARLGDLSIRARKTLRLASKSLRVPELIRRALSRGLPYQGLMCFSAEEALFLSEQGFDDFLIAYPTTQKSDIAALREVHQRGKKISIVVDHAAGARALNEGLKGVERPFPVLVDIDVSLRLFGGAVHLGVRRSPIRDAAGLSSLIEAVRGASSLRLEGMMAYEAQIAGLGDRNPFKKLINPIASVIRGISVRSVAKKRQELAETYAGSGFPLHVFNGGGTGSLTYAAKEAALTELTAGSALYSPHLFDYYSNIRFEPAAFFALQTVRSPDPGFVTCQGGGYIASGEPGWDRVPVPCYPAGAKLVSTEGCGEVQTPIQLPASTPFSIGDPVFFRHAKAGELAERFNEFLLVSGGKIVGKAKTYRGLGQCFF